jgi:signal transduction histidine kinase
MEELPICIISLADDLTILDCNSHLKNELKKYGITDFAFNGKILDYMKPFSKNMTRKKTVLSIKNVLISCIVSYRPNMVYVEPAQNNTSFIHFICKELKSLVSISLDMTNFLSKTLLAPEQKKYIDPLLKNNMLIIKTTNNAVDYLKISSGMAQTNLEDFYLNKAVAEVQKIITPNEIKAKFVTSRDVILSSDYKKFTEMVVHIISNSSSRNLEITVISLVSGDVFSMYFTDNGGKLSRYQRETIFEGFVHDDSKTDNNSLYMPIAKGIALLLGGDLIIESSYDYGTTYKFYMKTRDTDSD